MALDEYRRRAHQWGRQLSSLFAWWLVIEFGLVSLVLGMVVMVWPAAPEFLATAVGIWLLLLAGCRGFGALAQPAGWCRALAVVVAALCAGTGFMVLHAEWPARASANATALTFAAAVVAVGALLDGALARFGPRERAQPSLMRAIGWLAGALALMALMKVSVSTALASAAALVGMIEIAQSAWVLSMNARPEVRPDHEPGPLVEEPPTDPGLALLNTDPNIRRL